MLQFPPYAVLYALAVVVLPMVAIVTLRKRSLPGAIYYSLMLLFMALWSLTSMMEIASAGLSAKVFWSQMQYLSIGTVPVLWLLFCLDYSIPGAAARRWTLLLWVLPVAAIVLVFTNDLHRLIWTNVVILPNTDERVAYYDHGTFFWVLAGFSYACILAGILLLLRTARRIYPEYRTRALILVGSSMIVLAGNVLYLSGLNPLPYVDLTPLTFGIVGLIFFLTLYSAPLFELLPVAHNMAIDNMDEALLLLDPAGRLVDINPAGLRLLAASASQVIGRPYERALAALPELIEPIRQGASGVQFSPRGAVACTYEVDTLPMEDQGGVVAGTLVLVRDVSQMMRTQRGQLELAVEQQRIRLLSAFMSDASHAFRSPLASINVSLFLATRAPTEEGRAQHFRSINMQVDRLSELLDDILLITALESGQTITLSRLDVNRLLQETLHTLADDLARASLTLTTQLDPALPAVRGNYDKLDIAFTHILRNAMRFTPEGGSIRIRTRAVMGGALIEFVDSGIGMPDSVKERVFEKFYRAERGKNEQGFGLGLAIVQHIVEAHLGRVEVISDPGEGTTLIVWLPAAPAKEPAPLSSPTDEQSVAA